MMPVRILHAVAKDYPTISSDAYRTFVYEFMLTLYLAMEIDTKPTKTRLGKKRIDKRKQKKSSIAFTKYSDRKKKASK